MFHNVVYLHSTKATAAADPLGSGVLTMFTIKSQFKYSPGHTRTKIVTIDKVDIL